MDQNCVKFVRSHDWRVLKRWQKIRKAVSLIGIIHHPFALVNHFLKRFHFSVINIIDPYMGTRALPHCKARVDWRTMSSGSNTTRCLTVLVSLISDTIRSTT